jgi:outer membrane protein, adhesin transport system
VWRRVSIMALLACSASLAGAQGLPSPVSAPLGIDFSRDPVLALARREAGWAVLRAAVNGAIERQPGIGEYAATEDEARAAVRQAREQQLPSADLTLSSYRVISRDFSNDPENIIERSRPSRRTDALAAVNQTLFDFGASESRVRSASARLRGAAADAESAADRIALNTVAAWYEVFAYRALIELSRAFETGLGELRQAVRERIRQGASAEGDIALVDSSLARVQTRLAQYRRQLANAEARYTALTGTAAPSALERAPIPAIPFRDEAAAREAAGDIAAVRSAEANAAAARHEARAADADRLPLVTAGVDAGRYGVFENDRDYDIRGRVTLRQRLGGGAQARADQFAARARASDARAIRTREEAARDAAIAYADLRALEAQLAALEAAYVAARRSRDVLVARFQATRGTLLDVASAENSFFDSATAYIQGLTELDAARYVLLSRTGRLLSTLDIPTDTLGRRN